MWHLKSGISQAWHNNLVVKVLALQVPGSHRGAGANSGSPVSHPVYISDFTIKQTNKQKQWHQPMVASKSPVTEHKGGFEEKTFCCMSLYCEHWPRVFPW